MSRVTDRKTRWSHFMRSMFGEHVLNFPMLKSTAVSDAGITKQTLYEVSRDQFTRSTYDRAVEAPTSSTARSSSSFAARGGGRNGAKKSPCRTDR